VDTVGSVGLGVGDALAGVVRPGTVTGLADAAALLVGEKLVLGGSACWSAAAQEARSSMAVAATITPNRPRRFRNSW
jgi:hypothetical protein